MQPVDAATIRRVRAQLVGDLDLTGRNLLVTGVTSGLGLETARVLAHRGARIFGCARDQGRAAAAWAKHALS